VKNVGILFGDFIQWISDPFYKQIHNDAYLQFVSFARKYGLNIFVSTFEQCSNGCLELAWSNEGGCWKLQNKINLDLIYDKARANTERNRLKLQLCGNVRIFNHPELSHICWDKKLTYELFPDLLPLTICPTTKESFPVTKRYSFSDRKVLKPRFGIMGSGVRLLGPGCSEEIVQDGNFILQNYVDSSRGIPELGISGKHDLRITLINGVPGHAFVRQPPIGSIVSNLALGGRMIDVDIERVPDSVLSIVSKVDNYMSRFGERIYTIDFAIDENDRPWILEMESSPTFSYPPEMEYKKLGFMKTIATVLKQLTDN